SNSGSDMYWDRDSSFFVKNSSSYFPRVSRNICNTYLSIFLFFVRCPCREHTFTYTSKNLSILPVIISTPGNRLRKSLPTKKHINTKSYTTSFVEKFVFHFSLSIMFDRTLCTLITA